MPGSRRLRAVLAEISTIADDDAVMFATARLHLREPELADAGLLCAYYQSNAERFAPWEPSRSGDVAQYEQWIAEHLAAGHPSMFLAFRDASLVAVVRLSGISLEPPSSVMIAYTVDGAYEGNGYASEAVAAVVAFAHDALGMTHVIAYYHPDNVRSERLLHRIGFAEVVRTQPIPGLEHLMKPHVLARHEAC
jgi:ribosomal-protein-alanine N-acetyltransferase